MQGWILGSFFLSFLLFSFVTPSVSSSQTRLLSTVCSFIYMSSSGWSLQCLHPQFGEQSNRNRISLQWNKAESVLSTEDSEPLGFSKVQRMLTLYIRFLYLLTYGRRFRVSRGEREPYSSVCSHAFDTGSSNNINFT